MRDLRLAAVLPMLLLTGALAVSTTSLPAADDGPVVQMTVTPSR